MDKEAIIRKMAALRAIFEHKSANEQEAVSAMMMYNNLMKKYNLTEDEIQIKQEGVGRTKVDNTSPKHTDEMYFISPGIAKLANCSRIYSRNSNAYYYYGTMADRQYAEFLHRLIWNALEQAWKAYRYSFEYTRLNRQKVHGRKIRHDFRQGFTVRIMRRIKDLIEENQAEQASTGRALIVVKNALIEVAINNDFSNLKPGKALVLKDQTSRATHAGWKAGENVNLRQEMGTPQEEEDKAPLALGYNPS